MSTVKAPSTQNEILFKTLKELSPDITAADRSAAVEELGVSKSTISTYLTDKVHDNDTAVKLINFFKKRIQARFEAISK